MSYEKVNTGFAPTPNEDAQAMLNDLDKATAKFQLEVDSTYFEEDEQQTALAQLYTLADELSHRINETRHLFAEEYHLIEVQTSITTMLWVHGGSAGQAQNSAADFVHDHIDGMVNGIDPIDVRVTSAEHMETRDEYVWDDTQNADLEV